MWLAEESLAVEPSHNGLPQHRCLGGVRGGDHSSGERSQFFVGELPFSVQPIGKSNDPGLFFRRENLDLVNDLISRHPQTLRVCRVEGNRRYAYNMGVIRHCSAQGSSGRGVYPAS